MKNRSSWFYAPTIWNKHGLTVISFNDILMRFTPQNKITHFNQLFSFLIEIKNKKKSVELLELFFWI